MDHQKSGAFFESSRSEVKYFKKPDGTTEIIVEDDNGRNVYHSIEEAPAAIQAMLKKLEGDQDPGLLFAFPAEGGIKGLSDFIKGDHRVIEAESTRSQPNSEREAFSSKRKLSIRPSVELKSDVPWALILGAIVVALVLYLYITFGS